MKQKILLLVLCVFCALTTYSQKDSENQKEAEKDFCEILGELCSNSRVKDKHKGTITYFFDQEKLIQGKKTDLEAIVNLYKEEMLSPQDSFVFENIPRERHIGTEYRFIHYYKGLRVHNSTSILVDEEQVPYYLTTNVKPIDVDTTTRITIERAVNIVRSKYTGNDYLSVPLEVDYAKNLVVQHEYPSKEQVEKLIYFKRYSKEYCVVYKFSLIDRDDSDYSSTYYVNIANGAIELIPPISFEKYYNHNPDQKDKDKDNKKLQKKDFCNVLGEVCTHKTLDSDRPFAGFTHHLDSTSVDSTVSSPYADPLALIEFYKETMLSPHDSFDVKFRDGYLRMMDREPVKKKWKLELGYHFFVYRRYYKGLKVLQSRIIIKYTNDDIPYEFTTNAHFFEIDTTAQISIEAAIACLESRHFLEIIQDCDPNEAWFSTTHPDGYATRLFLDKRKKIEKFIILSEDPENKNKASLVYRISLLNPEGCTSDTIHNTYYVNAHTGELETNTRGSDQIYLW